MKITEGTQNQEYNLNEIIEIDCPHCNKKEVQTQIETTGFEKHSEWGYGPGPDDYVDTTDLMAFKPVDCPECGHRLDEDLIIGYLSLIL